MSAKVIDKNLKGLHTPVNPHAQRLLTAEARAAAKVPKGKAKAKAKVQEPKDKKDKEKEAKGKKTKKSDKEKSEQSGVPRTQFATAKKEFMAQEELLDLST